MKLSAYDEAQYYMENSHNEFDWVGNGPYMDAMGESTLEDAINHITSACKCILENWEDVDWPDPELPLNYDWIPANLDVSLLKDMKKSIPGYLGPDHPWLKEIDTYIALALLSEAA